MPTTALNVTPEWALAATGPADVVVPATTARLRWALTDGAAPDLDINACPFVNRGDILTKRITAGESLFVAAHQDVSTSATVSAIPE